jgi:hypothetical protein
MQRYVCSVEPKTDKASQTILSCYGCLNNCQLQNDHLGVAGCLEILDGWGDKTGVLHEEEDVPTLPKRLKMVGTGGKSGKSL